MNGTGVQSTTRVVAHAVCIKKVTECALTLGIQLSKVHIPQSYKRLGKNIGLIFLICIHEKNNN